MSTLETKRLTLGYGRETIIRELDITIPDGEITVLVGANGSGKSTLLRAMARLLQPAAGSVILDGREMAALPTREIARRLAILPQGPTAPEGLTVLQLVKQGRYPHQSWLKQWSREDELAVRRALEVTGSADLAERAVDSLSGGQRQRAWIAMVLAQDTPIVLLDEPTTYLDLAHQIELLDLLYTLNESERRTIVMVLHDMNLASRYAHHIVAIRSGAVYASGAPEAVMTPDLIRNVFGLECRIVPDPLFGTPMCVPAGKGRILNGQERDLCAEPS